MAKYRCKLIKMALTIYLEIPLDKNMQHSSQSTGLHRNSIKWFLRDASVY